MKHLLVGTFLFLTICFQLQAKGGESYLGLGYGVASTSSDVTAFDGIDGSVIHLNYGLMTSEAFAWEFNFRKTSFDKKTVTTTLLGSSFSISSEIDAMLIGGGFRWMFFNYLNIHMGLGYSSVSLNASVTGSGAAVAATADESGLGLYYGLGLQIPLGGFAITADYTINNFSGDVASNEIVGGIRFMF